jgi:predicted esterase
MIAFEIGFAIVVILALVGPVAYFGMRRYLRWMSRMAEHEEELDERMDARLNS